MIGLDGIARLLPRRRPMLLVDRIVEAVPGERITAVKAVTGNEPCYLGLPFGTPAERLAYPPALLVESWGQTAGLLASMAAGDAPEAVMLLGGVSDVRFHRPVHPGVVLEHRIRVALAMNDTTVFEGETLVDGEPVLSVGRMTIAYRPWDTIPIEGFGPLRSPAPAAETAAIPAQRDR
ncbi:beta-hydroxyacyl-ACP dehydratase [Kitasatospora sp. CM 4170]|uniref:3-hydroxyacyl-ACP dehydratase FabZ family protein n=1 Tax=Kitasatospora aburaviensis TaxID=67265 RepID=A0ABW1ESI1_9ACTN|nr:beta-hydroxyacyl-ACP dehydratase [Kitasatospora sp. CM 4170]WNM44776.1 beta-hydroxyacyl-ACP dehydratase [Kitasatospora sp. CM 4170]